MHKFPVAQTIFVREIIGHPVWFTLSYCLAARERAETQADKRSIVMGAGTLTITEENFETEVLNSETPVLVDFWAEWCAPCVALGPVIEELASDYDGKVKVGKLNIDEAQAISVKYGIMSIPTVAIFKGGEVVDMRVGLASKEDLADRIDSALG